MLETHLKSPVTRERLRAGPAADHIDGFADWLHRCGYAPSTLTGCCAASPAGQIGCSPAGLARKNCCPGSRRARWNSTRSGMFPTVAEPIASR